MRLQTYSQAVQYRRQLVESDRSAFDSRRQLAWSYYLVSQSKHNVGDATGAADSILQAVDIAKSLVQEHAHDDALKRVLTEFQLAAIPLLRESQRIAEARDLARQVAAQCEDDFNRNPSDRSVRKNLGVSLNVIGREHVVAGEPRAAQQAYERARELLESLTLPDEHELAYLIQTYALMSKCPAPGGPPLTPEGQAARQALADRAVETFRRAIAAGFRDVDWVVTNVDFSELRTRHDFQALIHDMVFPADPFAH